MGTRLVDFMELEFYFFFFNLGARHGLLTSDFNRQRFGFFFFVMTVYCDCSLIKEWEIYERYLKKKGHA